MKKSLKYREIIPEARRVVIKLGTRVLAQKTGRPDTVRIRHLVRDIVEIQKRGIEVVVVSSGAIGAGMQALGMKERPTRLPDLQMAAAVGQVRLMRLYDELFAKHGCRIGQILLTHDDFQHKVRLTNARRTIENLVRNRIVPIINENDVVADEEIKADLALGDNDLLASLVVKMIRADLLILLTTADGVLEQVHSGRSRRIPYIESIDARILAHVNDKKTSLSKGGMGSKLKAAHSACKSGCTVVIAKGRQSRILTRVVNGEDVGTVILASAL